MLIVSKHQEKADVAGNLKTDACFDIELYNRET